MTSHPLLTVLLSLAAILPTSRIFAEPVEIVPPELRGSVQPQVAMTSAGGIHVAFGKGSAIYHVASADGGRTFSLATKVANLPKLALGMRRGPRIAVAGDTLVVSAIASEEGSLFAWSSADGGKSWGRPVRINDAPNSAREGLHAMAGDGKGFVIAVWLDLRNKGMELWSATSRDSGKTWSANTRVYASPDGNICECCHPSVAITPGGDIAVMWRNWLAGSRDMYFAMSRDAGRTFSAAQKLGEGTWKLNGCPMDGGAVAFDDAGKPVTVWRREKTIFATSDGRAEKLLSNSGVQPVAFGDRAGPGFLWHAGSQLMLQRAGADPVRFASDAAFAAVATAPGRTPIAVWESTAGGIRTLLAAPLD